ncbi:TPA: hypothetical protein ACF2DS_000729 [Clostridium perfringens]
MKNKKISSIIMVLAIVFSNLFVSCSDTSKAKEEKIKAEQQTKIEEEAKIKTEEETKTNNEKKVEQQNSSDNISTELSSESKVKLVVKDLMSGDGKTKLNGQYAIGYYYSDLSDDDLVKTFNEQIKNKKLNYASLVDGRDKNKGYVFSTSGIFDFGTVDKTGGITKSEKMGSVTENSVVYY